MSKFELYEKAIGFVFNQWLFRRKLKILTKWLYPDFIRCILMMESISNVRMAWCVEWYEVIYVVKRREDLVIWDTF